MSAINNAIKYFKRSDPVMASLAKKHQRELSVCKANTPYFNALVEIIINQQLSVKAAAAICGRVKAAHGGRHFSSKKLLAMDEDTLRRQGLSKNKVRYIPKAFEI